MPIGGPAMAPPTALNSLSVSGNAATMRHVRRVEWLR